MSEPIAGLYEQLLTVELQRLLSRLEAHRTEIVSPDSADTHVLVAEHLRRILERALDAVPEDERLTRQAEICNALLAWLHDQHSPDSVDSRESLVVPLTVLREVRALTRGAAFSGAPPRPLVPLSSADLLVNARGEPSVGAAIERESHSANRIDPDMLDVHRLERMLALASRRRSLPSSRLATSCSAAFSGPPADTPYPCRPSTDRIRRKVRMTTIETDRARLKARPDARHAA